jgi:hypothetical protein
VIEHVCEHDTCKSTDTVACLDCWRWFCEEHEGPGHVCSPCSCTTCALSQVGLDTPT